MKTIVTAGRLFTPEERIESPLLIVEDGFITALQPRAAAEVPAGKHLDFPDLILAPGFIDIHIHGGAGHDVMEANDGALQQIESQLVKQGVTAYLPTTVTAAQATTLAALHGLGKAISRPIANHRRAT